MRKEQIKKHNQPQICPLTRHRGFPSHETTCSHGLNYIKECREFSSWFWYKVAQCQVEPITEERVPAEIVKRIFGRGKNEAWEHGAYKFAIFVESLEEAMDAFCLDKTKFFAVIHDRWDEKLLEEDKRDRLDVINKCYETLKFYENKKE